jgi:hypothetical protein
MHFDILYNENQLDALFILNLFRQSTCTCFGMFIAHHQEVFTVHVQQLVQFHPDPTSCQSPKRITRTSCCTYTVNSVSNQFSSLRFQEIVAVVIC